MSGQGSVTTLNATDTDARGATMDQHNWLASFAMACLVLSAGMAMGHEFAMWIHTLPVGQFTAVDLVQTATPTDDRSGWGLFAFILRNNLAVYVLLLFGLVSAGAVAFVILLGNGIALGQVIGFARLSGMPNGTLVELLLPHAVLELGSLCIAGAVGFQGLRLVRGLSTIDGVALRSLRLGLVMGFGVCTLTVAALIEAFITAEFAQ